MRRMLLDSPPTGRDNQLMFVAPLCFTAYVRLQGYSCGRPSCLSHFRPHQLNH